MYNQSFDSIDKHEFLNKYWQKAPCYFKGAFSNTPNFLSAEEIAGLSLDEEIESRLILQQPNTEKWIIEHGPLHQDRFLDLPDSHWTLLIQTIDHCLAEIQQLLAPFDFLPKWRFDDVMVSYATDQGGVGPHIDNYDVFLIQTEGKRHWKVGEKGNIPKRKKVIETLSHVQDFDPIIDVILEPGDMLYIPPDSAHHGKSIGESIGYSVGYRSIQSHQLLGLLTEHMMQLDGSQQFFTDQYRTQPNYSNHVEPQLVDWAQKQLQQLSKRPELLADLLLKQLSQSKIEPYHSDITNNIQDVSATSSVQFYENISLVWSVNETNISLYVEGERFDFDGRLEKAVKQLASFKAVPIKLFIFSPNKVDFPPVLASLVNMGHLKLNN